MDFISIIYNEKLKDQEIRKRRNFFDIFENDSFFVERTNELEKQIINAQITKESHSNPLSGRTFNSENEIKIKSAIINQFCLPNS